MRIAFAGFLDFRGDTGDSIHWRNLAQALAKRGHDVIAMGKGGLKGVSFVRLDSARQKRKWLTRIRAIFRMMSSLPKATQSCDWIVVRDPITALLGKVVSRKGNIVFHANWNPGLYSRKARTKLSVYDLSQKVFLRFVGNREACYVCPADALYEDLSDDLGIDRKRIFTVPHGVDSSIYRPRTKELVSRIKLGLGLNADVLVFGYAGSLISKQALEKLLMAFVSFHMDFPNTALVIVGDGVQAEKLRLLSHSLGIGESVIFTGRLPERQAAEVISSFSCCVQIWEGQSLNFEGVKLLSYLATGRPVITNLIPSSDIASAVSELIIPCGPSTDEISQALSKGYRLAKMRPGPDYEIANLVAQTRSWARAAERFERILSRSMSWRKPP